MLTTTEAICLLNETDPRDYLPGDVVVACGEPAQCVITFACPHEHVDSVPGCGGCAALLDTLSDVLICGRCEDGDEPHECRQVMSIEWFGEAAAREQPEA